MSSTTSQFRGRDTLALAMEGVGPPHQPESVAAVATEIGVPAAAHEVAIAVDVVCPDRLARQGFAVAPFYLRAPAASLNSLGSLFAALKFGALADETEVCFAHGRELTPSWRVRCVCPPESAHVHTYIPCWVHTRILVPGIRYPASSSRRSPCASYIRRFSCYNGRKE